MDTDTQYDQIIDGEEDPSSTYLTFDLGEQTLGVELDWVTEVMVMQKITPLPNAPVDVQGVVDIRGTSVPVVDLKARLGIPSIGTVREEQIVVIDIGAGSQCRPLGVLVDRVRQVEETPARAIQPCPSIGISHWDSSIVRGLICRGEGLIVLIQPDRLFGDTAVGVPEADEAAFTF